MIQLVFIDKKLIGFCLLGPIQNYSMYLSDGIKICQCQKTETRLFNIKVYAKIKNLKIAKIRMMAPQSTVTLKRKYGSLVASRILGNITC